MVAVCPAGQVTVPASRSIVNSSLLKYPFAAEDGWAGAVSSILSSAKLPALLGAAVVGVADHLGHRHRIIFEQVLRDLAVTGVAVVARPAMNRIRVDIDTDVQL